MDGPDEAATAAAGEAAPLLLVAHVARPTAASAVRRLFRTQLSACLPPSVVDDVAAALGELLAATCPLGRSADVGVAVSGHTVTVEVCCAASEPPELDELSHQVLCGVSEVWGVQVVPGRARCWASIRLV